MCNESSASSPCIVYGESPDIFQALRAPEVRAAILPAAWSPQALTFADELAQGQNYKQRTYFQHVTELMDEPDRNAMAFRHDLGKFTALFTALGIRLNLGPDFNDSSRLEPAHDREVPKTADQWHVDGRQLGLLSVLSGRTTEYLDAKLPGNFTGINFEPAADADVAAHTRSLGQGSVMIFKCRSFSADAGLENSLIHRRPDNRLGLPDAARVVVHYQLGSI